MGEKEGKFQSAIIELAEYSKWRVYHVVNVKGNLRNETAVGFPDLVLANRKEGIVFSELKSNTGRVSTGQEEWISVLNDAAFVRPTETCLWRPKHWDDIRRRLRG